ncbi:MAG: hypothetical protein MJ065_09740 [Oscillospiraceae bacterium]|nr:hypothetical protein [Oscillospiraceae bacterium]
MKKNFIWALLCISALMLCACGKTAEPPIAGADWRTFKGYGMTTREMNGTPETVYIESFSESAIVRLLEDSDDYTIIQEIKLDHEKIYDQGFLEANVVFSDVDGDGIQDMTVKDMNGDTLIEEVYIYDESTGEYVFKQMSEG